MFTFPSTFDRLIEAAAMSLLLCALGSAAVLLCRQPVRRMRIIVLTLGACMLAPAVSFVPGLPHWSLPPVIAADQVIAADRGPKLENAGLQIEETSAPGGIEPQSVGHELESPAPAADPIPDREPMLAAHSAASTLDRSVLIDLPTSSIGSATAATGSASKFLPDRRHSIVAAYLAGLLGLAAWWLVGLTGLCRVLRAARAAPKWCNALLAEVAGPAGARVQLLVSPRAVQPFTFAWRRPVIVLPMAMVGGYDNRGSTTPHRIEDTSQPSTVVALRCCLAHEWSHVFRGDVWTWSFAGVVRLVYYYQPLCWWLRRQLRLSQDYLADAAAARQSSPIEYAEFLATRALGQPLALGLGIAAGKSDLYRRVAMLLKDNRPLESRCPAGWTASVGAFSVALVLATATFGGRATTQGAAVADGVAEPAPLVLDSSPATKVDNTVDSQPTATDAAAAAAVDPATRERDEFVAALLKRAKPPQYFLRRSTMVVRVGDDSRSEELHGEEVVAGDSWRVVTTERSSTTVSDHTELFHAGRAWKFVERRHKDGTIDRTLYLISTRPSHATKSAELSNSVVSPLVPPAAWEFVEQQARQARLGEVVTVNDIESRVVEWRVFGKKNIGRVFSFDERGMFNETGTLRLYVAPGLNHGITRVEHVDRQGIVQVQLDLTRFEELSPGLVAPREYRGRIGEMTIFGTVDLLEQIDPATAASRFAIEIPAGTQIRDERPRPGDERNERGLVKNYDKEKYPNRQFITAVDYPDGLPDELVKKLDRELSPPEEQLRDHTSQVKPSAEEGANIAPHDSSKQKLIDGLRARAEAIKSGQFTYTVQINLLSTRASDKERSVRFVLSGERWAEFEEETPDTAVLRALNDGKHCYQFTGWHASENKPPKRRMIVNHPRRIAQTALWSSSLIEFRVESFRKHVAEARLVGTETTNGVETQVFEWPATAMENRSATSPRSDLAKGPGIQRVYIAPQLGFAVVKIKHLDKFGLAESVTDFSEFQEVAPGIFFPFREQYQDRTVTRRIHTLRVTDINQPIPEQLFVLRIPTGTQIEDVRPHRHDKANGNGPPIFDSKEYPLRNFTTWAEDLDGLPPAVLAEMDRDLLSPEEWERTKAAAKDTRATARNSTGVDATGGSSSKTPASPAPSSKTVPATATSDTAPAAPLPPAATPAEKTPAEKKTVDNVMFRYAGKRFDEWRDVLLTDLDPSTRIQAFKALQAFGPTAHAQEVAAAVQEALATDQPDLNNTMVQRAAFELLGRLGAPAVPVLQVQLASDSQETRRTAVEALARVAATTDVAVPVLLRAAQDGAGSIRASALAALIMQHPQSAGVLDAWSKALANDDDWSVQEAILQALIKSQGTIGELPAPVLFKTLESNVGKIRTSAAVALAMRGPGSDLVVEKIKVALLESAPEFRSQFVSMLFSQGHSANHKPNAAATVPVLIALLELESTYTPRAGNTDLNAVQALAEMPMDGPARAALPILIKAAEGKLTGKSLDFRTAAITALGKAGPAAKEALPALRQMLDGPPLTRPPASPQDAFRPPADPTPDMVAKWRSNIQLAIRRIEGN